MVNGRTGADVQDGRVPRVLPVARYVGAPIFQVRSPTLPVDAFRDALMDDGGIAHGPEDPDRSRIVLDTLVKLPYLMSALLVASPSAYRTVTHAQTRMSNPRAVEEALEVARKYVSRMSSRTTPFGLFAGVQLGQFAEHTSLALDEPVLEHARLRPDTEWLMGLLQNAEGHSQSGDRLRLNSLAYPVGERLALALADLHGEQDSRVISMRNTHPVQEIIRAAGECKLPYRVVAGAVQSVSSVTRGERAVVATLHRLGFLTGSSFLACPGDPAPLVAVADSLGESHPLREDVMHAHRALTGRGRDGAGLRPEALSRVGDHLRSLAPGPDRRTPFTVDYSLRLRGSTLSRSILPTLEAACEAVVVSTCVGEPRWIAKHRERFLGRYGTGAEVPLLQALDPDYGLGYPTGYKCPDSSARPAEGDLGNDREASRREKLWTNWIVAALAAHEREVELTPARVEDLRSTGLTRWPDIVEMCVSIGAASPQQLDDGHWRACLYPGGISTWGSMLGRFDYMAHTEQAALWRTFLRGRTLAGSRQSIVAELTYLPLEARRVGASLHPLVWDYEIPVNVRPSVSPEWQIPLTDMMLGATEDGYYVTSRRLGATVVATQTHRCNFASAPNVCRFLLEVSGETQQLDPLLSWEHSRELPTVPRLTFGTQVVLRPRQWNITCPVSTGSSSLVAMRERLRAWQADYGLPQQVWFGHPDERRLVDVGDAETHRDLARAVRKQGRGPAPAVLSFMEVLPRADELWLKAPSGRKHLCDLVIPMSLRAERDLASRPGVRTAQTARSEAGHLPPDGSDAQRRLSWPPGSRWVYAKWYSETAVLDHWTECRQWLHGVVTAGLADRWFFVRFADPESHIRMRLRTRQDASVGDLLMQVAEFGGHLLSRGVLYRTAIDTYCPEVERYGGQAGCELAERLFHASSDICLDLLEQQEMPTGCDFTHRATVSLDQFFRHLVPLTRDRFAQVSRVAEVDSGEFRGELRLLSEAIAPWRSPQGAPARLLGHSVAETTDRHSSELRLVGASFAALDAAHMLSRPLQDIYASVMHMHANRLLGIDRRVEDKVMAMWRHALRAINGRPPNRGAP